jgi:hypothetical protein
VRCLCSCNHYAQAADDLLARCADCGRIWKWVNGRHFSDWVLIAGPRTAPRLAPNAEVDRAGAAEPANHNNPSSPAPVERLVGQTESREKIP